MRRVERITLVCAECGDEYERTPKDAAGSKYCKNSCRIQGMQRHSVEAKRRAALDRFARTKHHKGYYEIELADGGTFLVDDDDIEVVKYWTWTLPPDGYVQRHVLKSERKKGKNPPLRLHRIIMERKLGRSLKPGERVDHRKGNRLDNRRSKLRLCTPVQNMQNARKNMTDATSQYKGVIWYKRGKSWRALITYRGRNHTIGYFSTEIEAAYAYDQWALQLFKRFAVLNVL